MGMIRFNSCDRWTKEMLFRHLTQDEIFEHYLPGTKVQTDDLFRNNPLLRIDKKPTCSFYWSNGKLWLKDWGWGPRYFDCINVVQYRFGLNYLDACKKIARDMGLIDGSRTTEVEAKVILNHEKAKIRVKRRDWTKWDLKYWSDYGICKETLQKYRVSPIETAWVADTEVSIKYNERVFVYHATGYEYKLYFVDRNKDSLRFLQNTGRYMYGVDQLPSWCNYIVLEKSLKDVMCQHDLGINSVCMSNESTIPSQEQMEILFSKTPLIFTLHDLDYTGVKTAQTIRKLYGTVPLFYPSRFNYFNRDLHNQLVDCHFKDTSDNRKMFGAEHMETLVKQFKLNILPLC